MSYNNIRLIYFSPTNTTKKIVEAVAKGINPNSVKYFDLTPFDFNINTSEEINNELVIIGSPVYSGRLPALVTDRMKNLKGNNSPAIIIVTYGNRDFDDALLELKDIAIEREFIPFAAAAFIGEHSFSAENLPIAHGRPDTVDLQKAADFGIKIKNIVNGSNSFDHLVEVPGNSPYKPFGKMPDISPITLYSKCAACGTCIINCPTGSIKLNEKIETDAATCILCCACIKNCPNEARINDSDFIRLGSDWLSKNCNDRKEPEFYF